MLLYSVFDLGTYRNVENPDEVLVRQPRQPDGRRLCDSRKGDLLDHHRHVSRHVVADMTSVEHLHRVMDTFSAFIDLSQKQQTQFTTDQFSL